MSGAHGNGASVNDAPEEAAWESNASSEREDMSDSSDGGDLVDEDLLDFEALDDLEAFNGLEGDEGAGLPVHSTAHVPVSAGVSDELDAPMAEAPGPAPAWRKVEEDEYDGIELFVDENKAETMGFAAEVLAIAERWRGLARVKSLDPTMFPHHLGMWLNGSGLFKYFFKSLKDVQPAVTAEELVHFFFTVCLLGFFNMSTRLFYDQFRWGKVVCPGDRPFVLEEKRFRELLCAVYPRSDRGSAGRGPANRLPSPQARAAASGATEWHRPLLAGRKENEMLDLMRKMADFACEHCLTKDTVLSLDDDLVRMSSSVMREYGMVLENNKVKGSGSHMDACGSVGTGIILSQTLHMGGAGINESVMKVLEPILTAREGAGGALPDHTEYLLAMDRGYNTDGLTNMLLEKGVFVVGTHARKAGFPFAWAPTSVKVPAWGLIPVQQPRLATWARRDYLVGSELEDEAIAAPGLALAYAEGRGKSMVALLHTNDRSIKHNQWSYVTYSRSRLSHAEPHRDRAGRPRQPRATRSLAFALSHADQPAANVQDQTASTTDDLPAPGSSIRALLELGTQQQWPDERIKTLLRADGVPPLEVARVVAAWRRATGRAEAPRRAFKDLNDTDKAALRSKAFENVEKRFFRLTQAQRSQDWFALRFGRVTSTGLVTLLATLRHRQRRQRLHGVEGSSEDGLPEYFGGIVEDLGKCLHASCNDNAMHDLFAKVATRMGLQQALQSMTVPSLRAVGAALGIKVPAGASKEQIVGLLQSLVGGADVVQTCLAAATLKPLRSVEGAALAVGSANERSVLEALPAWLEKNSKLSQTGTCKIEGAFKVKEYGLVHAEGLPTHATSVDGLLAFVPLRAAQRAPAGWESNIPRLVDAERLSGRAWNEETRAAYREARTAALAHAQRADAALANDVLVAAVEIKTRTTPESLKKDVDAAREGKFAEVVLDPLSENYAAELERFKLLVYDGGHRHQLLQHTATGVTDVFYVVSRALKKEKASSIFRVVHVRFAPIIVAKLAMLVGFIGQREMRWVWDQHARLPADEQLTVGRAKWQLTPAHVKQMRALSLALVAEVKRRGEPLPPARKIVPRLIDIWNTAKWVTDQYSERVKTVQGHFAHLSPPMRILIRLISTCILNASKTYAICKIADDHESWATSPRALRRAMAEHGSARACLGCLSGSDLETAMIFLRQSQAARTAASTAAAAVPTAINTNVRPMFKNKPWLPDTTPWQQKELDDATKALAECASSHTARFKLLNSNALLRFLRETSWTCAEHVPVSIPADPGSASTKTGRRPCWVCCMRGESTTDGKHEKSCKGALTSFWCQTCRGVPLCTNKRDALGGLTCFEVFHHPATETRFQGLPKDRFCATRLPGTIQHGDPLKLGSSPRPGQQHASPGLARARVLQAEAILARKRQRLSSSDSNSSLC